MNTKEQLDLGPWTIAAESGEWWVVDQDYNELPATLEIARLQSAAPELLEALKEFVTNRGTLTEWERRQKAFAAISKATGGTAS